MCRLPQVAVDGKPREKRYPAKAMAEIIGLTPEQVGMPLASATHTPGVSWSSPSGLATEVCGSLPSLALHIWWALNTGVPPGPIGIWLTFSMNASRSSPRCQGAKGCPALKICCAPAVEFIGERIPVHRFTVGVDGDTAGAAVLDKDHPVGTVLVLLGELLVLGAGQPRNRRGEQAGQVLYAFDEVAESVVDFGEFASACREHDPQKPPA